MLSYFVWICAFSLGLPTILILRSYLRSYRFFAELGIPYVRPKPMFGNLFCAYFRLRAISHLLTDCYQKFSDHRWFGLYDFHTPILLIRDPQLVQQMLIRDFDHFVDHRPFLPDPAAEPLLGKSLFLLRGDRWRDMRATLTPAFTGSKMRQMFHFVQQCAAEYAQTLAAEAASQSQPYQVEMEDLAQRYATDVIGTTAFGLRVNSLSQRHNRFYELGKECGQFNRCGNQLKLALMTWWPALFRWLGWRLFRADQAQFYHRLVHGTMRAREASGDQRPDMIRMLMEARRGYLRHSAEREDIGAGTPVGPGDEDICGYQQRFWDDDDITAQCFVFFFAGCETMSRLLSFAVQELMENWPVQRRLLAEIDAARQRLQGAAVTYDALDGCRYLDQVVMETLRKWPPATMLDRSCTRAYTVRDSAGRETTIPVGTVVWVPVMAIQRDARYFAQPDRFDPDRFGEERRGEVRPGTLLTMGIGPRNCIGSRFVMTEVKALLFELLTVFTFEVGSRSRVPVQLAGCGWLLRAKGGVNVHLRLRR